MSTPQPAAQQEDTSPLGTLAWVGVVIVAAIVALLFLSALGPVGGH